MQDSQSDNQPESHEPEIKPEQDSPAPVHAAPAHQSYYAHEAKHPPAHTYDANSLERHRLIAACSYLGVLFLIPLLAEKEDEFVRFHVRQGIVLFALEVIASFAFLNEGIGSLIMLVLIVISLVAAWRTYKGKKWLLPIVGQYAQRIKL